MKTSGFQKLSALTDVPAAGEKRRRGGGESSARKVTERRALIYFDARTRRSNYLSRGRCYYREIEQISVLEGERIEREVDFLREPSETRSRRTAGR